jgi:hypothetical protein
VAHDSVKLLPEAGPMGSGCTSAVAIAAIASPPKVVVVLLLLVPLGRGNTAAKHRPSSSTATA